MSPEDVRVSGEGERSDRVGLALLLTSLLLSVAGWVMVVLGR